MVTHVMRTSASSPPLLSLLQALTRNADLSSFHAHDPLRTTHWDTLEKSLTVFVLPPSSALNASVPVRRRLDLIFAPPEVYWTAVVGWCVTSKLIMRFADAAERSGSIMFQRDLRQWAKDRCGMKFDSSGMCVLSLPLLFSSFARFWLWLMQIAL